MVGGKNLIAKPLAKSTLVDIFYLHFRYFHYTNLVFRDWLIFYGGRSSAGRALDCESSCRGFEPRRSPHINFQYKIQSIKYKVFRKQSA